MAEIVITETDDGGSGDEALGEAAVAAAALSGVAAANASHALLDAEEAEEAAEEAQHTADTALGVAIAAPTHEEVRNIAAEEIQAGMAQLAAVLEQRLAQQEAPAEEAKPEPVVDTMPASVEKRKKRSLAARWYGQAE